MTKNKLVFSVLSTLGYACAQECVTSGAQCGGDTYEGATSCCNEGDVCNFWYTWYSECGPPDDQCIETYQQCGGQGYEGRTDCCGLGEICEEVSPQLSRCAPRELRFPRWDCEMDDYANLESPNVNSTGFALEHGRLRVEGTNLVDENGEVVVLHGVSSAGIHFYPDCYEDDRFLRPLVEEWGIEVFRAALYIGESGYGTNKSYIDDMFRMVDYCLSFGIYCLVDFHQLNPGDPLYYITEPGVQEANATEFWQEVATRYVGNPYVIYDLINEPNGDRNDRTSWELIKVYGETVIPPIRAIDPDVVLLISPGDWAQKVFQPYTLPLAEELTHNLMYAFHFYGGTHQRLMYLIDKYGPLIPIFMSEWGLSTSSGDGGVYTDTPQKFIDMAEKYNISQVMWNWADKDETSALLAPDTCDVKDFSKLKCSGGLAKYYMTTGSFPDQQCAATNNQCGGWDTGHLGPMGCCSENDLCVKLNKTYYECQTPDTPCKASFQQCGGIGYEGATACCHSEDSCVAVTDDFHQCEPQITQNACEAFENVNVTSGRGFVDLHGKLGTVGIKYLVNTDGDLVQLKGMDAGLVMTADSPEERSQIAANLVDNYGVNTFSYKLDLTTSIPEIKVSIVEMTRICEELGVYLILNFYLVDHESPVYYLEEPGITEFNMTEFWLDLGAAYVDKPHHLFQIANRIGGSGNIATQWEDARALMTTIIPALREVDAGRVVIVGLAGDGRELDVTAQRSVFSGTPYWSNLMFGFSFNTVTDAALIPKLEMFLEIQNTITPLMITDLQLSSGGVFSTSVAGTLLTVLNREKATYIINGFNPQDLDGFMEGCWGRTSQALLATSEQVQLNEFERISPAHQIPVLSSVAVILFALVAGFLN